ncbi:MAG TPA: hypothetical protein VMB73_11010 [Acetobacteraceae bacterium]|jgi:hypothetical protein|nr:hypothetical protein [Acetobacteraceae bacterium]
MGYVLLPLCVLYAGRPESLLQLALVVAPFEASAAIIIGNFGLQLAAVPGMLFVAYVMIQYSLGMRYPGEGVALKTLGPLMALLGYALLSIAILPDLFAGKVFVAPQKPDPFGPSLTPLEYTSGNMTQTLYLAQNVITSVLAALFVTRRKIAFRGILSAYLLGGYIEIFIACWQFASRVVGVPFPDDVIYSNPGWAIVSQSIGEVPRIQGSFSEPAGLAVYMVGLCFCSAWLVAQGHRTMRPGLLLGLSMLTVLISTSTTGLVCLVVGLPLELAIAMAGGTAQARARLTRVMAALALGGALAIGPVFILKPSLLTSVDLVVTGTLSKQDSDSFKDRTALDEAALATVSETGGLGVGWGSFRPSSLVPGLLANGGVFAVLMLIWLGINVARLKRRCTRLLRHHAASPLIDGLVAAVSGQVVAALVSAPSITSLAFFLQIGCLVGAAARVCVDASSTSRIALPAHATRGMRSLAEPFRPDSSRHA